MKFTKEQEDIFEAGAKMLPGHIIKIDAVAGSGKTSTLVGLANVLKESSICLVFNKAAQLDAEERFPSHVECRTTNSLAFQSFGIPLIEKLNRPKGKYVNVAYTGAELARHFSLPSIRMHKDKTFSSAFIGILLRNCVSKFEQSADLELTKKHLPYFLFASDNPFDLDANKKLEEVLFACAKQLWIERIDPNSVVMATHDTYMKLYQLSNPKIDKEIIYLDEAQDTNECFLDVINKQNHAKVIIVGDSRQAIYGWRGAVNALNKIKAETFSLTTSFRYGQKVADLAMKVLENSVTIKSLESLDTQVVEPGNKIGDKRTFLYRTNSKLLNDALVALIQHKEKKVNIEIDTYNFCQLLTSAQELFDGAMHKVKHEDLLCYSDYAEFKQESLEDANLGRIAKIVETGATWSVVNTLKNHKNSKSPDFVFTTAHKSKGREWDTVVLGQDYPSPYNSEGDYVGLEEEEQNLLYVACTRAKKELQTNESIHEIVNHFEE